MDIMKLLKDFDNKTFSFFNFMDFNKSLREGQLVIKEEKADREDFIKTILAAKMAHIESVAAINKELQEGKDPDLANKPASIELLNRFCSLLPKWTILLGNGVSYNYKLHLRSRTDGTKEIVQIEFHLQIGDTISTIKVSENDLSYLCGYYAVAVVLDDDTLISNSREDKMKMLNESSIARLNYVSGRFVVEDDVIKFKNAVINTTSGLEVKEVKQ